MNIYFIDPLSRAWKRMKKALFQPFDLKKWFVVGFTAFLAELTDTENLGDGGESFRNDGAPYDLGDILEIPNIIREWLMDNTGWFTLIIFGLMFVAAVIILLIWLSSMGKFMFLDNVIHDKAEVVKPWREYRMHGNSLFLWRLGFTAICFATFILFSIFCFTMVSNIYEGNFSLSTTVLVIAGMVLLFLALIVAIAYISLFLTDFVVPIMYKNNITTMQAWNRFLPLFTGHLPYFIFYGVLICLLWILVVLSVVIVGLVTCCIGFLLLIIPYIGSVVTLPISFTFRAFSVEFLEQFGPEFVVFPESDDSSVSSPVQQ